MRDFIVIIAIRQIKGNTTTYTYDKSNRMKTVSFGGSIVTYEYDTNGNRKSVTYGGGVSEEYSYDRNNRLLTLTNKKPDRSVISSYSYTYDLAGRQTGKTDSFGTSSYTYDAAGRVTRAETPGKTSIYAFDRSGNRISMTYASLQTTGFIDELSNRAVQYKVKKSQYVYTDTNRLVKLVEEMYDESSAKVLTKTVQYVYDGNGNQVSEYASYVHPSDLKLRRTIKASVYGDGQPSNPDPLIDRTLTTYDGFNRLKKVERMEAGVRTLAEYMYNGDDLRVRKTVKKSDSAYTPEVTSFLYDRQHVILEMDNSGNVTARYVRGINYIAKVAGGDETYFLYNGHGDVVQTVTAAGEVRNEYDYDIFGNPMLTVETAACSIRYAGEYLDNETGLYYLRARYYDPNIGRFISEDSYWGEDDNPLSLNLYTYAFNDPIRFIDPTGHNSKEIDQIINEINTCKETWLKEEQGAGKNSSTFTQKQKDANKRAEELRAQLAKLDGSKEAKELRDKHGNDAGAWERYQLSRVELEIGQKVDKINDLMAEDAEYRLGGFLDQFKSVSIPKDVKVTKDELNKLYKLQMAVKLSEEKGRNIFGSELTLDESSFKRKGESGEYDTRDLALMTMNGSFYELWKNNYFKNSDKIMKDFEKEFGKPNAENRDELAKLLPGYITQREFQVHTRMLDKGLTDFLETAKFSAIAGLTVYALGVDLPILLAAGASSAAYYMNRVMSGINNTFGGGSPPLAFAGAGMSSVLYKSEAAQALAVGSEVITADILSKHVLFADKYGAVYDAMKSDSGDSKTFGKPGENGAFKTGDRLPDNAIIVRGGESKPVDLIKNQAKDSTGNTLSANGGLGVPDKTLSNGLPQNQISKCTVGDLRVKGYDVIASPTPDNPYHVSIKTPGGAILTDHEATNLSSIFTKVPNLSK